MSQLTATAIKASLKKLLNDKPLDKITVKDIVEDCGINRKTFYYHFRDIYDVLEVMLSEELRRFESSHKNDESLEECIFKITDFIRKNKKAVKHIYDSIDLSKLEKALYDAAFPQIKSYIETHTGAAEHTEEDIELLSALFSAAIVGAVLRWLRDGVPDRYDEALKSICKMFDGSVEFALNNLHRK